MAIVVTTGKSTTIRLPSSETLINEATFSIGLPALVSSLGVSGLDLSEVEVSLGGGFAYGNGPIGGEIAFSYVPGTEKYGFNVGGTFGFLGCEFSATGTLIADPDNFRLTFHLMDLSHRLLAGPLQRLCI